MKHIQQVIVPIIMMLILVLVTLALVIAYPTFNDVKKMSELGTAVSGLSTPAIGVFTSILLFITLTKQAESNRNQQIKNESDIIFMLLNQLDNEIMGFYTKYNILANGVNKEIRYSGLEGLNNFCKQYCFQYERQLLTDPAHKFHTFKEAPRLIIIVDSFNLIKKRIELSQLSHDLKNLFIDKLSSIYNSKLKNPFTDLSETFKELNQEKDEYPTKIIHMVNECNL